ncbi:PadR family transcriptional regulator [Gordonia hankookensis]|uniref:PadR family transcriptional regulator n=1 Tax=Gordonia hankookensis TaxID=589403 RepID=A0ABR7WI89_9ACTN|nr:PadR family transcriptional regulator [Gordonia hankookensis]MBD1322477.1 PadR family transcriptional regulator [Gordonia hankookensis]
MPRRRKVTNLVGLAVLAALVERPMHRYEIATVLRERGKDRDMAIKWGSLYTVVDNLTKHSLVEVTGVDRDGARPERTIYAITDAGRSELVDWTRELISTPGPQAQPFVAGLSVAAILPPEVVVAALDDRLDALASAIDSAEVDLAAQVERIPRLFTVEAEYSLAMLRAEAEWVRGFRVEIDDGSFPGIDVWRRLHEFGLSAEHIADLVEKGEFTPGPP